MVKPSYLDKKWTSVASFFITNIQEPTIRENLQSIIRLAFQISRRGRWFKIIWISHTYADKHEDQSNLWKDLGKTEFYISGIVSLWYCVGNSRTHRRSRFPLLCKQRGQSDICPCACGSYTLKKNTIYSKLTEELSTRIGGPKQKSNNNNNRIFIPDIQFELNSKIQNFCYQSVMSKKQR